MDRESFHSRLRDEFFNCEEFESASDANSKAAWWRRAYNKRRQHSSLSYKTPMEFSAECERGLHGQPPKEERKLPAKGTTISGGSQNGYPTQGRFHAIHRAFTVTGSALGIDFKPSVFTAMTR